MRDEGQYFEREDYNLSRAEQSIQYTAVRFGAGGGD
jgi:hypothetical protein